MFDRSEQEKAARTLREALDNTRGKSRRIFLQDRGKAVAGSAMLTTFDGMLAS